MTPQFRKFLYWFSAITFGLALANPTHAAEETFGYSLTTSNCLGETVDIAYYDQLEVYVDVVPIPASEVNCPGDPGFVADVPPSAINTVAIGQGSLTMSGGEVTVDLVSGLTYYARARVRSVAGVWSQLSLQRTFTIEAGIPQMPTVIRLTI